MKLVHTLNEYNFYIGKDEENKSFYNVVHIKDASPTAGYYNSEWICKMKGFKNIFAWIEKEHQQIKEEIKNKFINNEKF